MEQHDEYIADSEDEDMVLDPSVLNTSLTAVAQPLYTPDKSSDTSAKNAAHIATVSSPLPVPSVSGSSNSTSVVERARPGPHHILPHPSNPPLVPSNLSAPSASTSSPTNGAQAEPGTKPRPRPKPRPAYKVRPDGNSSNAVASASSNAPSPITTTDPLLPPPPQPVPQLISPSLEFAGDIAERTKMRSRTKPSGTTGGKNTQIRNVIELTSDSEDELSLLPSSKSKGKGKAKPTSAIKSRKSPKRPKLTDEFDAPPSTMNTLPVASETTHLSSQLPPSDPPIPSSSVPPTSNPALANSPPSSPIPPVPVRKRKRAGILSSDDEGTFNVPNRESQKLMPPPPHPVPTMVEGSHPAESAGPSSSKAAIPAAKPKARKKRPADEEEDWVGDLKPKGKGRKSIVDDEEEDWADKPKRKPARKSQKKKKAGEDDDPATKPSKIKGKQSPPKLVVEVVISPSKRRSPEKPTFGGDEVGEETTAGDTAAQCGDAPGDLADAAPVEVEDIPELLTSDAQRQAKEAKGKGRARKRALISSDEESDSPLTPSPPASKNRIDRSKESPEKPISPPPKAGGSKENELSGPANSLRPTANTTPSRATSIPRATSLIPKASNTPMSELIRRVNSKPGSPFTASRPSFSPFSKSSKTMLKRIAPLHPNRRTPPPPPPRPPQPKKTKKQLEMEEQWEMELEESVEGWFAMSDEERAALRRAKRDAVFGVDD